MPVLTSAINRCGGHGVGAANAADTLQGTFWSLSTNGLILVNLTETYEVTFAVDTVAIRALAPFWIGCGQGKRSLLGLLWSVHPAEPELDFGGGQYQFRRMQWDGQRL
jgi:hypothetical protein